MRRIRTFFFVGAVAAVLAFAGCAGVPRAERATTYPGFDVNIYPGAAALQAWKAASPYAWIGYYLPAPCHRETSWVGKRREIARMGWGIAVLYVGQQLFENDTTGAPTAGPIICSRTLLTPEQGRRDALDAVGTAQAEGFVPGSVVFLDVERMEAIPPEMEAYYRVWTETVLEDGRYMPGTYAHRRNAEWLFAIALDTYREAAVLATPPFWVTGGPGFTLEQPASAVGLPFAVVWQGSVHVPRTWGGVSLVVDENVATRPSPSAPLQPR